MSKTHKDKEKYKFRRPLIGKPEVKFKNPKLDYDREKGKRCEICDELLKFHEKECSE